MKKLFVFCLAAVLLFSVPTMAGAKMLKLALDRGPVSQDPHVQFSERMLMYSHWVFDPLLRIRQDMGFEPRLAKRWERIDDLTVRFYLRKGVKFHSGNLFTAADVKFTIERLSKNPEFQKLFAALDGCYIINDHVLDITTSKPYAPLINLATCIFPMDSRFYSKKGNSEQPEDTIPKDDPALTRLNSSGTGAYKVTHWEPGNRYDFERFGDYWDNKSPGNVSKIILTPIKKDAARVAALLSGEVDLIAPVPPRDFQKIRKDDKVRLVTWPGDNVVTIQLNQKRRREFQDVRVRRAIVYALNNTGIAKEVIKGMATPAGQHSPKGYPGHNPDLKPRYNLKKARALMKAAGLEKGFECTMVAPGNLYVYDQKIAEATVAMLAEINIRVSLKTIPRSQFWNKFEAQTADIQMIGWHSKIADSGSFTEFLSMCPNRETGYGRYNSGNYCNPEIDRLAMAAQAETDLKKRAEVLQTIAENLYEAAAFVPLHWQSHTYAAKNNVEITRIVNPMNYPYLGDLVIK
jgi:peptide/nickel transport system substrate-binding protein